jgi:hypothetical protein
MFKNLITDRIAGFQVKTTLGNEQTKYFLARTDKPACHPWRPNANRE